VRINALGKQKQLKEAQAAHAEMEASGMAGNVVTFTALIDGYTRCGLWEEALKVYYRMQRKGVAPNKRTYNSLIAGCEHDGQWQVRAAPLRFFYVFVRRVCGLGAAQRLILRAVSSSAFPHIYVYKRGVVPMA
jgi:pentatricopeptide repeat protein